jgi:acyl-CoA dehydrogenase
VVHKATVARRALRGYRPHEGYWPTEYIPAKRDKARRRMGIAVLCWADA